MQTNTATRPWPVLEETPSPGLSPITASELQILARLDPDQESLCAILTVKAIFDGTICQPR